MKRTLSLRTMLISLFLAAVIGAVALAATGWITTQRLVEAQRFILGETLAQQEAGRDMVDVIGRFGQRHAGLLAADSESVVQEVTAQATLDERFRAAREALTGNLEPAQLQRLDTGYTAMLDADASLEAARQEDLRLGATMTERVATMQRLASEVMERAAAMAEHVTQADQQEQQALYEQIDAWKEEGITTLPTTLLDRVIDEGDNVVPLSYEVRASAALLAGLSRQLVQEESREALADLRRHEIAEQFSRAREALQAIAGSLRVTTEQSEMAAALGDIVDQLERLMVEGGEAVYALRDQQLELQATQQQTLGELTGAMRGLGDTLAQLDSLATAQAGQTAERAEALADSGRWLLVSVALAVILVLMIFGWRSMARVLGPLAQMRQQMERIGGAAGEQANLAQRLKLERDDEIGRTAQAFNQMMDTFEDIIAHIRDGAESIAANSQQIAAGNEDLSQRTEEQSSSLAQSASSIEQITATVRQTADYAHQARDASQAVDQRAHAAGEVAGRTTAAMQAIRQSSEKITSIITAIDDIAFQTNLLALNASVEAARAGEQGRGFSVVAQEVRKLASRSAEEAVQIRRLVADSVTKVGEGASLVSATSTHLQEITDSLKQVRNYVTEIADATQEQSAGIEQINRAIAQLDQMTYQNAQLVQDASSASQLLNQQAADMHTLVGRFQVSREAAPMALPGPSAPLRLANR